MDEVEHLRELLTACHRALEQIRGSHDELAEAIRETCRLAEERLAELEPV